MVAPRTLPAPVAFDDPVPAGAETVAEGTDEQSRIGQAHRLEHRLQQVLRSRGEIAFDSLTVRPMPNAVCVQGVAHGDYDRRAVAELVRQVADVDTVIDQVVTTN